MLQLRAGSPQSTTQLRLGFPEVFVASGTVICDFTSQEVHGCHGCSASKVLESPAVSSRVDTDLLFSFPSEEGLCNVMWWEGDKDLLYTNIPALAL